MEYGHQYLIFGWQQDKMDAPLVLFLSFFLLLSFLPSSFSVFLLCACTVLYMRVTVLRWGQPVIETQGESDRATQKVGEKQHSSCALSHFVLLLLWRLAGQRESEGERTRLDGGGGGDEITPVLVAD